MSLIYTLIVGLIAGYLAGVIMKGKSFGLIGNLIVGVVGAFLGSFIMPLFGFWGSGLLFSVFSATIGAVILLVIISFIKKA